jgi:hypothetical protein
MEGMRTVPYEKSYHRTRYVYLRHNQGVPHAQDPPTSSSRPEEGVKVPSGTVSPVQPDRAVSA